MPLGRREFLKLSALVAAGASLQACSPVVRRVGEAMAPPVTWIEGDLAPFRILNRITYGPTLAERTGSAEIGVAAWIEEQLRPASIADPRAGLLARQFTSLTLDPADLAAWDRQDVIDELKAATLLRRAYSNRQLYERMVEFWTDHFNISVEKGDCWYLKTVDDRQVIRRHALGNFHDLLAASAQSPAMLVYLDNQANHRQAPNENYARELLELHTLGVEAGYRQTDVMELARCLTGWTIRDRFWRGEFVFREEMHAPGVKTVLGRRIEPAGRAEAEAVVQQLAEHPQTARRIVRKMARRFLALPVETEGPLVERGAAALLQSGGEIEAALRVVLLDGLAASADLEPKYKRPVDLVASALRMSGASTDGGRKVQEHLTAMGQPLFEWPTPDGPPEEASAWQSGLFARWGFAYDLARNQLPGTRLDPSPILEASGADEPRDAVDAFAQALLGSRLPNPVGEEMAAMLRPHWEDGQGLQLLLAGLLASPGFQWR